MLCSTAFRRTLRASSSHASARAKPWLNAAAARASAANAATFPDLPVPVQPPPGTQTRRPTSPKSSAEVVAAIGELGARVILPSDHRGDNWASLAGGEAVREAVEEALLLPLAHPEAFAAVARATRAAGSGAEASRTMKPPALLFFGPPGTGKTVAARIAAGAGQVPLVACPLEMILSKWYGEGERNLAALFTLCEQLGAPAEGGAETGGRGAMLFLDEIDALGGHRDREMHEASRRMLSVLLRYMDGFDSGTNVALVGATNRPADLDSALLSRFDVRVCFPAPDAPGRAAIFGRYARQLSADQLARLGDASDGMTGRDIVHVCMQAERRWVCAQLRGREVVVPERWGAVGDDALRGAAAGDTTSVEQGAPPPLRIYEEALARRADVRVMNEPAAVTAVPGSGGG